MIVTRLVGLSILTAFMLAAQAAVPPTLTLAVGEKYRTRLPHVDRISVPHPEIADVFVQHRSGLVTITGISQGVTTLTFWESGGHTRTLPIRVRSVSPSLSRHLLAKLTSDMPGLRIRQDRKHYFIEGVFHRADDYRRLMRIESAYPQVFNNASLARTSQDPLLRWVKQTIAKRGYKNLQLAFQGNTLVISGTPRDEGEANVIEHIATEIYPRVHNLLYPSPSTQTQFFIDLQFLEVQKHHARDIGLTYPSAITLGADISAQGRRITSSGTASLDRGLTLKALNEKGLARVLSNPKLLVRDGVKSSFSAGGEIPIRLVSERSAAVDFKAYGIRIQVVPRVVHQRIQIDLDLRVSDLDSSTALDGIPGLLEHALTTSFETQMGETLVLGGMLENRTRKNVGKLPFWGSLPILGELFKSRSFQDNKSELVLALTPLSSQRTSKTQRELLSQVYRFKSMRQDFNFSLLD